MPGPLIAFWIMLALGGGLALSDKEAPIWGRVDRNAHSSGRIDKPTFRSTISATPLQVARKDARGNEVCEAVVFAFAPRTMRVQIDGQEQMLDTSWGYDVKAGPSERRRAVIRFLEPVGGAEAACHEVSFVCVPEVGWNGNVKAEVTMGERCRTDAGPQKGVDQSGKPRLRFQNPGHVMTSRYVQTQSGGFLVGSVVLVAEVQGEIDEEWYCPRVEWELPLMPGVSPSLTSKSTHEEDCEPYTPERAAKQGRRISRHVTFPEGQWQVTLRLWKGDTQIAARSVTVVVGSDDPNQSRSGW